MKPRNWKKLSKEEKKITVDKLFNSMRGFYIISQALQKAIDVMKQVPEIHREQSNIEDMEILREQIFNFPIVK